MRAYVYILVCFMFFIINTSGCGFHCIDRMAGDSIETMPVTYPNVPMPGLSRGGHGSGSGMRHPLPYPPAMGPRMQRMPGSGNGSHLYTSFE